MKPPSNSLKTVQAFLLVCIFALSIASFTYLESVDNQLLSFDLIKFDQDLLIQRVLLTLKEMLIITS